ncbi:arginase family protein [Rubrimonas cliftonensis]|uniref:Arginase n=1 Tax=Rubrimonas cliftonensis TaxID=89524 RepID=A0A1H4GAG0_9RHOB|nr:arginase family protein [Rubrimonas cliftonensis]SEB06616.1 arginase [Rubrimonas cliftonensis]
MAKPVETTLRLLFPQWQGGNNPPYTFGSELLEWLAPPADGPVEKIEIVPFDGTPLKNENGIVGRTSLQSQIEEVHRAIDKHSPNRIIVLGGDCGVSLAPFAYLNKHYDGELAVLWLDTHPDIMTPDIFQNAHAMVMGSLLGEGDPDFLKNVSHPVKPHNVMFAGMRKTGAEWAQIRDFEASFFERLQLRSAGPEELADTSAPVIEWLKSTGARKVAIHFDLDVLDPHYFRSLLFANPEIPMPHGTPHGRMRIDQVTRVLNDVADEADIVGLTIAEHMPWDSLNLKNMLQDLPLIGRGFS